MIRPAALLVSAAVVAGCFAPTSGSERLELRAPAWSVEGAGATLEIRGVGAFAELRASVVVAVDGKVVDRVELEAGRATAKLPAAQLVAGSRIVSAKSGSERSEAVVRVVRRGWILAAAGGLLAVAAGVGAARRRRRLSR